MMVLVSIKSLQAAESILPVVKLHLTQRELQRILRFYWLLPHCFWAAHLCDCDVSLELECRAPWQARPQQDLVFATHILWSRKHFWACPCDTSPTARFWYLLDVDFPLFSHYSGVISDIICCFFFFFPWCLLWSQSVFFKGVILRAAMSDQLWLICWDGLWCLCMEGQILRGWLIRLTATQKKNCFLSNFQIKACDSLLGRTGPLITTRTVKCLLFI